MTIKERRTKVNISQKQLAKMVGVSQQAIAKWECGKSLPRSDKLPIVAKALSCSVDDILKS